MTSRTFSNQELGFTLVEILIAVVILATSLTVILGLQSAVIDRTVSSNVKKEALLATRQILSAVEAREANGIPLDTQIYEGSISELLTVLLEIPYERGQSREWEAPELQGELLVEYWGIPQVSEQAMKRVQFTVRWGESEREALRTTLFIPFDEDELAQPSGEDDEFEGLDS